MNKLTKIVAAGALALSTSAKAEESRIKRVADEFASCSAKEEILACIDGVKREEEKLCEGDKFCLNFVEISANMARLEFDLKEGQKELNEVSEALDCSVAKAAGKKNEEC